MPFKTNPNTKSKNKPFRYNDYRTDWELIILQLINTITCFKFVDPKTSDGKGLRYFGRLFLSPLSKIHRTIALQETSPFFLNAEPKKTVASHLKWTFSIPSSYDVWPTLFCFDVQFWRRLAELLDFPGNIIINIYRVCIRPIKKILNPVTLHFYSLSNKTLLYERKALNMHSGRPKIG